MNVIHTTKSAIYRSWEEYDKTTLIVAITDDGVSLHHIDSNYTNAESTLLQLSAPKALDVAERIQRVLRGEPPKNPIDQPAPQLFVAPITDGDPYREGVRVYLSNGNWMRDFHFNMTTETAQALAKLLQSAQE
jgi:hypothetical protein